MTEVWLLVLVPLLAWMMARMRSKRAIAVAEQQILSADAVSAREMEDLVKDLSPSLRPSAKVTAPNLSMESGHVWDSPSGKRVYMN